jgi:hypothetical protein
MEVNICFELRDKGECDRVFGYLAEHPEDVWDYEERVGRSFHLHLRAHWTQADVVQTRVSRFRVRADVHLIQYLVTLRAGASDPRLLVDMLRRCGGVQEGVVRAHWRVLAWYNREGEAGWAADAGNGGGATRHCVRVLVLLCRLRQLA